MKELIEAIAARPDRIMLDNFSLEAMRAGSEIMLPQGYRA